MRDLDFPAGAVANSTASPVLRERMESGFLPGLRRAPKRRHTSAVRRSIQEILPDQARVAFMETITGRPALGMKQNPAEMLN
jgi:hypothetical protein